MVVVVAWLGREQVRVVCRQRLLGRASERLAARPTRARQDTTDESRVIMDSTQASVLI